MNLSRAASLLVGARLLRNLIQALNVDLVHCHGFRADILVSKCALHVPAVSTIHADYSADYQLLYGKLAGTWMARREYAALQRFDRVIAVSETAAEAARSHGVQCEVIANGIDLPTYHPPSSLSEKVRLRERLGLPLDRRVVLHSGRLTNIKRPVDLVAGFLGSRLSTNAVLLVAGEGPLRGQCEQAAAGAKNIFFLGKRQDIPELLRASDVVISNSLSEGMPMALLEACASGIHVIASDISSHRHIRDMFAQQVFIYQGTGLKQWPLPWMRTTKRKWSTSSSLPESRSTQFPRHVCRARTRTFTTTYARVVPTQGIQRHHAPSRLLKLESMGLQPIEDAYKIWASAPAACKAAYSELLRRSPQSSDQFLA